MRTCSTWSWRCACGFVVILHLFFINFFHFFDLIFPGPICIGIDTLRVQLLLQFSTNHSETMHICSTWSEDVHVVLGLSSYHTDLKKSQLFTDKAMTSGDACLQLSLFKLSCWENSNKLSSNVIWEQKKKFPILPAVLKIYQKPTVYSFVNKFVQDNHFNTKHAGWLFQQTIFWKIYFFLFFFSHKIGFENACKLSLQRQFACILKPYFMVKKTLWRDSLQEMSTLFYGKKQKRTTTN